MELHLIKKPLAYYNINIVTIFITIVLILLLLSSTSYKRSAEIVDALTVTYNAEDDLQTKSDTSEECDIFSGEWVPDPNAPYYTNTTCWAIYEAQDCLKNGRPDLGFLKWRWRPDGCELPPFDPFLFLNLVSDRTMAFIGDSLSRNHMQSMMCLLSVSVADPVDVSKPDNPFSSWKYESYNFTMVNLRSPFLVRFEEPAANTRLFKLYLDELDESWTSQIEDFDYIILNVGHWYARPAIYHQKRRVVGCHNCQDPNITGIPPTHGLGIALRAAFDAINSRRSFHGTTFLRSFSPSHFQGKWSEGADCPWRTPLTRRNETALEGFVLDVYETQLKEFRVVERESAGKIKKFRLLDLTRAMLMRPDGHPSRYGHGPNERKTASTIINDCLHWCLPGPIDSWSDFLLHMMNMEQQKSSQDKLFSVNKKMMLNKSNNN